MPRKPLLHTPRKAVPLGLLTSSCLHMQWWHREEWVQRQTSHCCFPTSSSFFSLSASFPSLFPSCYATFEATARPLSPTLTQTSKQLGKEQDVLHPEDFSLLTIFTHQSCCAAPVHFTLNECDVSSFGREEILPTNEERLCGQPWRTAAQNTKGCRLGWERKRRQQVG